MYTRLLVTALMASAAVATDGMVAAGGTPSSPGAPGEAGIAAGLPQAAAMASPMASAAAGMAEGAPPAPPMAGGAPPMAEGGHGAMAQAAGELTVQIVSVSDNNGTLKYFPESIQAPVGSVVQFQFHPKNHTVTESSFDNPCVAKAANLSTETRPGLKSGFVPVTGSEETTPIYNVLINDTAPIWLFCGQKPHCKKGMVMVINQNLTQNVKTLEKYKEAAMAIPDAPAAPPAGGAATTSAVAGIGATASASAVSPPAASSPPSGAEGGRPGPPASPVGAGAATTTASGPSTFTGAASRQDINLLGMAGVAGLIALL